MKPIISQIKFTRIDAVFVLPMVAIGVPHEDTVVVVGPTEAIEEAAVVIVEVIAEGIKRGFSINPLFYTSPFFLIQSS